MTAQLQGSGTGGGGEEETPLILALHFLGGSARSWEPLARASAGRLRWGPVDLPGFGAAAATPGYAVEAMADAVEAAVRALAPRRWALAGHSMGAKVACAVARRAEDGAPGLAGLVGLVLLAGSPPAPEPMDDDKRAAMLGWFAGDAQASRGEAEGFIAGNVGAPLYPDVHARAVDEVLRAARPAWTAWLAGGSREDWAARIGVLETPALILAGEADDALGAPAQARLMAPHFRTATLATLPGAGHLLPLERPERLADMIVRFLDPEAPAEPTIDPAYLALIASPRVDGRTRAVLLRRAEPAEAPARGLSPDEHAVLRATLDRVVPQDGPARIDLAARVAATLLGPEGDGWRFADLPPDGAALRAGLGTLDAAARAAHGAGFAACEPAAQDALLVRAASGDLPAAGGLAPGAMRHVFEDIRSAATQAYVAHPATQARLGFGGIANRGLRGGPQGFVLVGAGQREAWEPEPTVQAPR